MTGERLTDELMTLVATYKVLMQNMLDRKLAISNLKMIYPLEKIQKMVYKMDSDLSFEEQDLFGGEYKEVKISPLLVMSRLQQGMIPMSVEDLHKRIDEIHDELKREMRSQRKSTNDDEQYERIIDFLLKRAQ